MKLSLFERVRLQLRTARLALGILARQLGWQALPGVLFELARRGWRGEPWQDLPPPAHHREKETRDQGGPAIVLLDTLTARVGSERALAIVEEVVTEAAVLFLEAVLPRLDRAEYLALTPEERRQLLGAAVGAFPNATTAIEEVSGEGFSFRVTRCEFQELLRAIGRPELGRLFCAGDAVYFERQVPEVRFTRPHTLAGGAADCPFHFRWRERD
jgi:hypothetical protein